MLPPPRSKAWLLWVVYLVVVGGGWCFPSSTTTASGASSPLSPALQRALDTLRKAHLHDDDIIEVQRVFLQQEAYHHHHHQHGEEEARRNLRAPPSPTALAADLDTSNCPVVQCICPKYESTYGSLHDPLTWYHLLGILVCVMCGATASGLTLGLLSLDPLDLQLKVRAGNEKEQAQALKVLPIISKHHFVLVSLLLFNAAANETLPLFLDNIVPSYMAIIISVTLVLIFGEVIPSAIFTGPRQLQLGAAMAKPVWVIMAFFSPISYPISKVLDRLLGHEGPRVYSRKELATLISFQSRPAGSQLSTISEEEKDSISHVSSGRITTFEADLVQGILEHSHVTVMTLMLPFERVYALDIDSTVTPQLIEDIVHEGYSRIVVYEDSKDNLRGYVHIRKLLLVDPTQPFTLGDLTPTIPVVVGEFCEVGSLLASFQEGSAHMAFISKRPEATRKALEAGLPLRGDTTILGIVTMEDVLEEILQQDIRDEKDVNKKTTSIQALTLIRKFSSRSMRARSGGLLDPELIITPDHHVPFLTEGMSKRFSGLNKNTQGGELELVPPSVVRVQPT